MSNDDIHLWARNAVKGNVGFLVLTAFICSLPSLISGLISHFSPGFLPAPLEWALDFVSSFMRLGAICVVLKLIHTGEQDLTALTTPFRSPWIGKAIVVVFFLSLWPVFKTILPDKGLAGIALNLVDIVITTILFPVRYILFFFPDWPVGKVIWDGLRTGYSNLANILNFQIILGIPMLFMILLITFSSLFGTLAVPIVIAGFAAIVAYGGYINFACTKYAMERFMK